MRRFREFAGGLAFVLPPAHVTERLTPWFTIVAAVTAATFALAQYSNDLDIRRVSATLELHRQYRVDHATDLYDLIGGEKGEDQQVSIILETRCKYYKSLVEGGELDTKGSVLPDCSKVTVTDLPVLDGMGHALNECQREELRARLNQILSSTTEISRINFGQIVGFFRSVRLCVDQNTCDAGTALALFEYDVVSFLNASCAHLENDPARKAEAVLLAGFVRKLGTPAQPYWSNDPNQTDPFSCGYLRMKTCELKNSKR